MHPRRFSRTSATALHLGLATAAPLAMLVGCAVPGDFGRWRYVEANTVDPIYTGATAGSAFPLTDDERQLRALGNRILAEPYVHVGKRGPAVAYEGPPAAGLSPAERRNQYASFIASGPFRSATARYSRLIDDTRNDLARLDPFFQVARRVADLDRKRQRGLANVPLLSEAELIDARRRVRENMMLMAEVQRTLQERAEAYRFALERLVIAVPSPMAVDAERLRSELEQRLAAIEVVGAEPGVAPPRVATAR